MASSILSDNGVSSGSAGIKTSADSTGALALQTTTAGGTATTAVTINTSQNVGIGITPSSWASGSRALQVSDVALQADSAGYNLVSNGYYDGVNWKFVGTGYATTYASSKVDGSYVWYSSSASGSAGSNISFSPFMAARADGLHFGNNVSYNSTIDSTRVGSANISITANNGFNLVCNKAAGSPQTAYLVFFWNNGLAGYVAFNGTGVNYNTGSDVRLKRNIVDAPSALSTLNSYRVRSFEWKATNKHEPFGFIAQELHEVAPSAVTKQDDKADGSMDMPWGVDTSKLVPFLFKAIQEQQALITTLTERITALEGAQA